MASGWKRWGDGEWLFKALNPNALLVRDLLHCFKGVTRFNSFNLHNNLPVWVLLMLQGYE